MQLKEPQEYHDMLKRLGYIKISQANNNKIHT